MKTLNGRKRVVIEAVEPEVNGGKFPVKRVIGEKVVVQADIFSDGHDSLSALVLFKKTHQKTYEEAQMTYVENDRWKGEFTVANLGIYTYTIIAWVNHFITWQRDLRKKIEASQDISVDLLIGAALVRKTATKSNAQDRKRLNQIAGTLEEEKVSEQALTVVLSDELNDLMDKNADREFATLYENELKVIVDPPKAIFSSWYEMFPRSCLSHSNHGTFRDCEALLPVIARMGFDVLYLPPVHPIGRTKRKGRNNTVSTQADDVGSPWAIGAEEGGHKSVLPALGTIQDFQKFVQKAKKFNIDIALDIAFQCSPDHPYVKDHPDWFSWRPDGTVQYAENPPKKYEDILPLNFETERWKELWLELKSIFIFWIEKGVHIFRVDNPHTKPFSFWEWVIQEIKLEYPDCIFLSEAFTRPKVMYRLAKTGFTQSYTYFAWRNTKQELMHYVYELTQTGVREYFRPNFWPNTPDILPEHLQYGGRNAFMMRLVLAATLSSNYGIYGPAYELAVNESLPGKEEYANSEKYEVKRWDTNREGSLRDFIARVNHIRKENPALQQTFNIHMYEAENDNILFYAKTTEDLSNIILVAVNMDPFHVHSSWVNVPVHELGIDPNQSYLVHDLLGDDKFIWQGERNYIEINPYNSPACILKVRKRLRKETDFDYFM